MRENTKVEGLLLSLITYQLSQDNRMYWDDYRSFKALQCIDSERTCYGFFLRNMQKSVRSCQRMYLRHKLKWWHVLNRCSSTQRILCLWHRCTKMVKCAESGKCKPLHLDATMTVIISKVIGRRLKKSLSGSRLSEGIWLIDWSTAPVLILTTQLYKRDWNRKSSVSQWMPWIIQPLTSSLCWVSFTQSHFRKDKRGRLVIICNGVVWVFLRADAVWSSCKVPQTHHTLCMDWLLFALEERISRGHNGRWLKSREIIFSDCGTALFF